MPRHLHSTFKILFLRTKCTAVNVAFAVRVPADDLTGIPGSLDHHLRVIGVDVHHPAAHIGCHARVISTQGRSPIGHGNPKPNPISSACDGYCFACCVFCGGFLDSDIHLLPTAHRMLIMSPFQTTEDHRAYEITVQYPWSLRSSVFDIPIVFESPSWWTDWSSGKLTLSCAPTRGLVLSSWVHRGLHGSLYTAKRVFCLDEVFVASLPNSLVLLAT